ncbi:hypothetical protein J6590_038299 [Homalodisca vitripennis]|nr:hypothetical protein J6590_038299 [Homalodisca vitripennis]
MRDNGGKLDVRDSTASLNLALEGLRNDSQFALYDQTTWIFLKFVEKIPLRYKSIVSRSSCCGGLNGRGKGAKKPSLTLNLATNGLKVTSEPPPMAEQVIACKQQTRSTLLPSLTLNLATNGLKVTSEPPPMAEQVIACKQQTRSTLLVLNGKGAKKPSLTLNLATNGLKVTSEPPPIAEQVVAYKQKTRSTLLDLVISQ